MSTLSLTVAAWPRQMNSTMAAAYVGESSSEVFLRSCGSLYPRGTEIPKKGLRWLRDDLDAALLALHRGFAHTATINIAEAF